MSADEAALLAREPAARYLQAVEPALVRQFELLATAPAGVARLRELILTLAVQGKLVPQVPGDGHAAHLLRQVESTKEQLVSAGVMKRPKAQAPIAEEELPFAAPTGWQWVRLGTLLQKIGAGSTPLGGKQVYVNTGVKFLRSQNVWNDGLRLEGVAFISSATHAKMAGTVVVANDLLFNITGASIGRCAAVPANFDKANVSQHVTIIRPVLPSLNAFLHTVLISRLVQQAVMDVQVGVSREGLSIAKLGNFLVPIPPLQEQARIVARVDELMRLCDALEAQGRLEAEQHARLRGTLLGTLTDSSTPEELAANWQRVAAHFDLLLDRPEAVDALEQAILQLAVRGLLVPQDLSDEHANALVQRVRFAREASIVSGGAKRGKSSPSQATFDEPFALPAGWTWSTLPDLCAITGGSTPSKAVASNWIGDIPWVSPKDMKVAVIEDAQDHVSSAALAGSLSLIAPGSLLMVVRGMILAHSFPVAVTRVPVTINQDMKALTPFDPKLLPFLMLLCEGMKTEVLGLVNRSTHGTCKLESPKIFGLPIPLPPLAEQVRIATLVTELRRLCADLRQRLTASQTTKSHLAEALVDSAIA